MMLLEHLITDLLPYGVPLLWRICYVRLAPMKAPLNRYVFLNSSFSCVLCPSSIVAMRQRTANGMRAINMISLHILCLF